MHCKLWWSMNISVIGSNFSNARFSDVVRLFAAKFSVDSTKSILRCSWDRFAHAQRNFRCAQPNQFCVAAEIVSPMRSEKFHTYLTLDFVERAQRKVRCTWPKKFRLRLEISSKECSEQFDGLRNQKSHLKDVLVSKKTLKHQNYNLVIKLFIKCKFYLKKIWKKI